MSSYCIWAIGLGCCVWRVLLQWNVSSPHYTRPRQALSLQVESEIEDRKRKSPSPLSIYPVNQPLLYPCHWSDYHHKRQDSYPESDGVTQPIERDFLKSPYASLKCFFVFIFFAVICLSLGHTHQDLAWALIYFIDLLFRNAWNLILYEGYFSQWRMLFV